MNSQDKLQFSKTKRSIILIAKIVLGLSFAALLISAIYWYKIVTVDPLQLFIPSTIMLVSVAMMIISALILIFWTILGD